MRAPTIFLLTLVLLCLAPGIGAQDCQANFSFGETGLTINFLDESTSAPGDPVTSWSWDFEDGSTSTEQNPSHTFPEADTYDVCLDITTQSGCTSQLCVRIEICVLDVSVSAGNCDANNEVPVTIIANDLFDNAGGVNISVDGQLLPGSPFAISIDQPVTANTTVPGDGLPHTVIVQSEEVGTCSATYSFTVPDCSSGCFLSGMNVSVAGGATQVIQVGDNFFSPQNTTITIGDIVEFQWVGDGHSTTSDATTGPDSWNSGVISFGSVYTVNITNPGAHGYYCIPHGGPNGQGMSGIIVANCPASGQFALNVTFNTTIAGPAGYNILLDGAPIPGSPFSYTGAGAQSNMVNIGGDGMPHVIEIQDVADPTCIISRTYTAPDCGAAPPCSISVSAGEAGGCNAANNVPVEVTVNAINGGSAGFNIFVDGVQAPGGPFNYNPSGPALITVDVPGDGQNHTLEARDVNDPVCTGSTALMTTDCTIPCAITNLGASTGSSTIHTVLVEDFAFNPRHITITAGDKVQWDWVGSVEHTSTSDAPSGPDSWDSGLLGLGATFQSPVLSAGVHPYYCIPHGAPGGVGMSGTVTVEADCTNGMVSVAVSFIASGGGFNGYEVLVDGSLAGSFAYDASGNNTTSVPVPGDGQSHSITVRDADAPGCSATTSIITPDCNAPGCQLNVSAQESAGCDSNGEVAVELVVADVGGGASGFEVLVDGAIAGAFLYSGTGTTAATVNVAGDGQPHNLEARDIDSPACAAATTLMTTNCAVPCAINELALSVSDGGNPMTHVVEVRDFEFVPANLEIRVGDTVRFEWTGVIAHTSTSDANTGPDSWDSGLLGQGEFFEVTITTEGEHPYYCIPHGAPGGIGMSGVITALPPCDEGTVALNVSFVAAGGSAGGYSIFVDGSLQPESPFNYSGDGFNSVVINIPGDGQQHTVRVEDSGDAGCWAVSNITSPDCGQEAPCSLSLHAVPLDGCNEEDKISVELTVVSEGVGSNGFFLQVDGILYQPQPFPYGPSGFTNLAIEVTGTGEDRLIEVLDVDSTNCLASATISTPLCGPLCEIQELVANSGQPGKHIVEVRDFEFFPRHLKVATGDTIEFFWTGAIPHTTTSDVISGPNSWDSGLLEQGDTYQVIITEAGLHPYYCIPHGGPGGIGMSGTIEALSLCENGEALVTVGFSTTNGSSSGYNIFLDGEFLAGPIPYGDEAGYNSALVRIPGDEAIHLITVQDLETSFCAATTQVTAPDCSAGCAVSHFSVIFPEPERHLVEVLDFEFSPREITVTAGDTIVFFWTGAIPHTTTSDATSGPDSWDSGLLGAGSTYEVVISEPGNHPYYCVPHGGPGGVGMAGAITALPACQGDSVWANISFNAVGGSDGFSLLLDGEEIGQYDYQNGGANELEVLLLGDGLSHEISILDTGSPDCGDTLLVEVPQCTEACLLDAVVVQIGGCDDNMEVPFELTVSGHSDQSEGFRLLADGVLYPGGPYDYEPNGATTVEFSLTGDGQTHELVVEDISNPSCVQSFELALPNCLEPCAGFHPEFSIVFDSADSLRAQFVDETEGNVHQWLWGFGDGVTSNVQNPFHTYDHPGTYTVCLLAQDTLLGCNAANCRELQVGVTNTNEARHRSMPLRAFPNPAKAYSPVLLIEGLSPADFSMQIQYSAHGLRGERIAEGLIRGSETMALPLGEGLPPGMYFIVLHSPSGIYSGKIVVQ